MLSVTKRRKADLNHNFEHTSFSN